jgi:hypothetical protein
MKSKKIRSVLIAAFAAMILGWVYYLPYYTMHQVQKAAQAGDANMLSRYIDIPALRENIRGQLIEKMTPTAESVKNNPFAVYGNALVMAIIGPLVDAMITPRAIAAMVQGSNPASPTKSQTGGADHAPTKTSPGDSDNDKPVFTARYADLNRFEVTAVSPIVSSKPLKMTYLRRGLGWKLAQVELPF